jgi:defect-in-organelle-trafficking protein DotC
MRFFPLTMLILSLGVLSPAFVNAAILKKEEPAAVEEEPASLKEIMSLTPDEGFSSDGEDGMPFDIREEALKEAAVSYGARAGLAWRTYFIRKEMVTRAKALDKVYDFRQLLITAPSGLLIEPPIINENLNAMIIEGDGQQAAVSDRIYNISNNARIVSSPRNWRTYLEREWGIVEPPPNLLRPQDAAERLIWEEMTTIGWEEGVQQADEIFEEDLNQLIADFEGMIRYRTLLTQGMVSAPYALQVDRGVTGGGDEMRIGDRAVHITGKPSLINGHDSWQPAQQ